MNPSYILVIVLVLHFLGDFVFQSDTIAKQKSKNIYALAVHVLILTHIILIGLCLSLMPFGYPIGVILAFAYINGMLHFITDYFTSKASAYFYAKGQVHNYFVVLGLDQTIHLVCYVLLLHLGLFQQ